MTIEGTFQITLHPQPDLDDEADGVKLARYRIDKVFAGGLVGESRVHMLAASTPVEGSAGYVALERVQGTLAGRRGGFVLQHSGSMQGGSQALTITVVPGSGTGDLVGLSGTFHITIRDGQHSYRFDYAL